MILFNIIKCVAWTWSIAELLAVIRYIDEVPTIIVVCVLCSFVSMTKTLTEI